MQVRSGEAGGAFARHGPGHGYPLEHGLRTCLVAVRLAERADVDDETARCVYYLALLHSIGCTADAPEAARAYGDDLAPRASYTLIDGGRPNELMAWLWRTVRPEEPLPRRVPAFLGALAAGPARAREGLRSHCEVGHRLAGRLGMPDSVREGLTFVFERFDGKGLPDGVAGEEIPLAARLLHAARDADAFHLQGGTGAVEALGRERSGRSLDPHIAALLVSHAEELFAGLDGGGGLAGGRLLRAGQCSAERREARARLQRRGGLRRPQVGLDPRAFAGRGGARRGGRVARSGSTPMR